MRFSKTFCKPSSVATIVPVGLPAVLQYDEFGLLQRYSIGFSEDLSTSYCDPNLPKFNEVELFEAIRRIVPGQLNVTGGTSWVYGVFYTDRIPCDEGNLPTSLYKSFISEMIKGGNYSFYAGYATSLAASFRGPVAIRNFLGSNRFDMLPQGIVPVQFTEDTLQAVLSGGANTFRYEFISGLILYEGLNCRYSPIDLIQVKVSKEVKPYVGEDGYIKGDVVSQAGETYTFSYSAIVHHGVAKGCTLLLQEDENGCYDILATRLGSGVEKIEETILKDVKCPICNKVIKMGISDAPVQCDDPHCLSRLYYHSVKMCNALKINPISYDDYRSGIDNQSIRSLTDVIEIASEGKPITTTLSSALYAAIPAEVISDFSILERFANKCNGKKDTVAYYLDNPLRIDTDLDIVDPQVMVLADWLKDEQNGEFLKYILNRVDVVTSYKKFDGAPIFRGNRIAITGGFKHGDYPEICSILQSYDAEVVPEIALGEKLPDVVITGSLNSGISGAMIQKARLHSIPIWTEDDFFTHYEIDNDLAQNLL